MRHVRITENGETIEMCGKCAHLGRKARPLDPGSTVVQLPMGARFTCFGCMVKFPRMAK